MSDLRDFLAWFDGFCENIKARPSAEQWAKVVERIRKIEALPFQALPAAPTVQSIIQDAQAKSVDPKPLKPRPVLSSGSAMSAGP